MTFLNIKEFSNRLSLQILVMVATQTVIQFLNIHLADFKAFPGLLDTLTNCKEKIDEGCGMPLTGSSSQDDLAGQQILDDVTGCRTAAVNFIRGSLSSGSSSDSDCLLF